MWIIRKTKPNGKRGFKTYDGWVWVREGVALELDDVMRFTNGEAKDFNLKEHEEFVYFGCYNDSFDL